MRFNSKNFQLQHNNTHWSDLFKVFKFSSWNSWTSLGNVWQPGYAWYKPVLARGKARNQHGRKETSQIHLVKYLTSSHKIVTLKKIDFRIGRKHWGVLCLQINQCSAEFHQNTSSLQDKECLEITVKHYTWYRQKYSQLMKKPNFSNLRSTNLKNPLLKYTIKLLKSNHPSSFPLQFIDCPVLAHTFRRLLWCDGARSAFKFRCCQS